MDASTLSATGLPIGLTPRSRSSEHGISAGLDRKPANATRRMSAHALLQEFLNLQEQLYGLVTNGKVLRLLRDSSRLVKQSYLEFDLDRIFSDGLFADFAVLYRLLHATRLPLTNDIAAESLIERYHQDSLDQGARNPPGTKRGGGKGDSRLCQWFPPRGPTTNRFGTPLLPANSRLGEYYQHLLRLIYRLLFLMVIEERDLVFPKVSDRGLTEVSPRSHRGLTEVSPRSHRGLTEVSPRSHRGLTEVSPRSHRVIYRKFYSVNRLRRLSERRYLADPRRHDLWLALQACFRLFEADGPGAKLGIAPLAGDLFAPEALGPLADCSLGNDVLLGCLRSLSIYRHPKTDQRIRVNYAALNVEEFGSVYEGTPRISTGIRRGGTRAEIPIP